MKDKQIVALTDKLCPICGRVSDHEILISSRLQDISHLDHKATGFGVHEKCARAICI